MGVVAEAGTADYLGEFMYLPLLRTVPVPESPAKITQDVGSPLLMISWMMTALTIMSAVAALGGIYAFLSARKRRVPANPAYVVIPVIGFGLSLGVGPVVRLFSAADDVPSPEVPTPAETPTPSVPIPSDPVQMPGEPTNWTPWIIAGIVIVALLVSALIWLIGLRARHQILDRKAEAADREKDWQAAVKVFNAARIGFAEYLADPYAIFERPLLDDNNDPLTAAFITALDDAEQLHTDSVPQTHERIERFHAAARTVADAWMAADQHARKIGMGILDPAERKTLDRIRGALAIALDESAPTGEREAAIRTVTRLAEELPTPLNTDRIAQKLILSLEYAQRKALAP